MHPHTRRRLVLADSGMTYQLLVPDLKGPLSMLYIELPPFYEFRVSVHPSRRGGRVRFLGPDRDPYRRAGQAARPGESIRFNLAVDHGYKTFEERVVVITAQTPPSF